MVASPTYKATFTGLLKVFLDRFPADGLRGAVAVPMMLGAGPGHALAPENGLRSVLVELGAVVPARGLYLVESEYDQDASYSAWLEAARLQVTTLLAARAGVHRRTRRVPGARPGTQRSCDGTVAARGRWKCLVDTVFCPTVTWWRRY